MKLFRNWREKPEIITRFDFDTSANKSLALVDDPEASFDETISAAKALSGQIERIRTGKLEVRPPIAAEELDDFAQRAAMITTLGEKASQHLAQAGEVNRGADSEQAQFAGTGDLPKA